MPAPNLAVLRRRAEFLAVAKHGRKWVTPGFILQLCPAPDADKDLIRYGLTATIKSVGNAVQRNRARRRLRALAREALLENAMPGHDYVLIARNETGTHDYAQMKKDLVWALKKTGTCREKTG